MLSFLCGANALGCWVAGLFFLRFWRRTGERLFAFFAAAFWAFCLNWIILVAARPPDEARHLVYVIRVIGFLLLIYAVIDKNRSTSETGGP